MNPKLFIGDFIFLLFFISQGIDTHHSDSNFFVVLFPFLVSITLMFPLLTKINFIEINEESEYVRSTRVWIATIAVGTLIRFVLNSSFEPMFLFVIICYSIMMSGVMRIIHSQI